METGPSREPRVLQLILKSLRGGAGIAEIRDARPALWWWAALVFCGEGMIVLLIACAAGLPFFEGKDFLITLMLLPLLMAALLWVAGLALLAVAGRGQFAAGKAAFASSGAAWILSVVLALMVTGFHLPMGHEALVGWLALGLLGGIGWAAVYLRELWVHLLGIRGGWATLLSAWVVTLALVTAIRIWLSIYGTGRLTWDEMSFLG